MRTIEYKRSFEKTFRSLAADEKVRVREAIGDLLVGLESGSVAHGLGLKRLQGDQWEVRADLSLRVCFRMSKDLVEFALVGTHDTIRKFLKNL